MKRLNRILLVNWYLLDAVEIPIEGHTAFIGPNASGKSSLLDAVQAVLLGGHGHYLSLNPSAGEKSTRSLRDYCLGVVRDPEGDQLTTDFKPREQCVTYLALSFVDLKNGEETALGLALHASIDQPNHQIDGRFIAPRLSLILHDLLERKGDARFPKPWPQLRDELRARCPELQVIHQPEQYVRKLGELLSHDGRQPFDHQRFLKNFRNAITFAPLRNVSDFVRRFILDERPIKVRELQRSLQSYREIHDKTREVRGRVEELKKIDALYRDACRAAQLAGQYGWVAKEAEFQALEAERLPVEEALAAERERRAGLARDLARLEGEHDELATRRAALRVQLEASDLERERARLDAEREGEEARLEGVRDRIGQARRALAHCRPLLGHGELLPKPLLAPLAAVAGHLEEDGSLLAGLWPERPAELDAALAALHQPLAAARRELEQEQEQLVGRERDLARELGELQQRIKRLEQGEADLSPATLALQALLQKAGIASQPLCELIDVTDEGWRDTIEAYLGAHREALIVAPEETREAVALYRREGRRQGLHGCRIVNTGQSGEWSNRRDAGSLAELIGGDNPHAVAYANRLLGHVIRVEGEEELLHHGRAATADGMLHANGAVSRMKPLEPMLGRGARDRQRRRAQARFAELATAYSERQQGKEELKGLLNEQLRPLAQALAQLPRLTDLATARDGHERRIAALAAELAGLADDRRLQQLRDELAGLDRDLDLVKSSLAAARDERERGAAAEALAERRLAELEALAEACAGQRREREALPGLDRGDATALFEKLEREQLGELPEAEGYRLIQTIAAKRADEQRRRADDGRERARGLIADHRARHGRLDEGEPTLDHAALESWVVASLAELEESMLGHYAEQAQKALDEAEQAFRADFVGRLHENLALLDDKLREINRYLRDRPFHGEFYKFVKRPNPELEAVIRWVESWTPEESHQVGGLFDALALGEHPHAGAIRRVRELLMEESGEDDGMAAGKGLADYRNYYVFDVQMSEADGRNPTLLSRRIGKGSGGEHQAPFYVAIGAALAATYRLSRDADGTLEGGMALALFDEAFSKLDVHNTVNALEFLDDLGLQVLLAAPDEKYGLMSEQMQTIVNVYRAGGAVDIDVEYIKAGARALLGGDNPLRGERAA